MSASDEQYVCYIEMTQRAIRDAFGPPNQAEIEALVARQRAAFIETMLAKAFGAMPEPLSWPPKQKATGIINPDVCA